MSDKPSVRRAREELARRDDASPGTPDPRRPERDRRDEQERAVRHEQERGGAR